MSLVVLNKSGKNRFKNFLRKILNRERGPQMVTQSLLTGLKELGVSFVFNPPLKQIAQSDIIYVNESVEALKEALKIKKAGKCSRLIAGPAITVFPEDENSLMMDKNIDVILQPAEWVKNMWVSRQKGLQDKIKIWWAGVSEASATSKDNDLILYIKNAPDSLVKKVKKVLEQKSVAFREVKYGSYKQSDYFQILSHAKGIIFLSRSESQGLALCEAWIRNVSALVWSSGVWKKDNYIWRDEKISAPYLNDRNGLFFKGENDFEEKLGVFLEKIPSFSPREDALVKFSHKNCAENFLKLIKQ